MPFQSDKQRKYMFEKHPEIAKRWVNEDKGYVEGKEGNSMMEGKDMMKDKDMKKKKMMGKNFNKEHVAMARQMLTKRAH